MIENKEVEGSEYIKNLINTVDIVETRILSYSYFNFSYDKEGSILNKSILLSDSINNGIDLFTYKNYCLYLNLLGECYFKLATAPLEYHKSYHELLIKNGKKKINFNESINSNNSSKSGSENSSKIISNDKNEDKEKTVITEEINEIYKGFSEFCKEFKSRCLIAYETAISVAERENFDIVDSTYLLSIYSYCCSLSSFQIKEKKIKKIAMNIFHKASNERSNISRDSLHLLQMLRDNFLINHDNNDGINSKRPLDIDVSIDSNSDNSAILNNKVDGDDEDDDNDDDDSTLNDVISNRKNKSGDKKSNKSNLHEIFTSSENEIKEAEAFKYIKKIRKLVTQTRVFNNQMNVIKPLDSQPSSPSKSYVPSPILVESLSNPGEILGALERIFKTYVRGNTLPGRTTANSSVIFNVNQILPVGTFLLQGPYLSWKGFLSILLDFNISSFPSSRDLYFPKLEKSGRTAGGLQPIVNIKQATTLFIETSRCINPLLTLQEYLITYEDMIKRDKDLNHSTSWKFAQDWVVLDGENIQWDIDIGINFMQFIDCMSKIGVIGFSSKRFKDSLPTQKDKIQHFFTAFLNLSNERKWSKVVEAKLESTKLIFLKAESNMNK